MFDVGRSIFILSFIQEAHVVGMNLYLCLHNHKGKHPAIGEVFQYTRPKLATYNNVQGCICVHDDC